MHSRHPISRHQQGGGLIGNAFTGLKSALGVEDNATFNKKITLDAKNTTLDELDEFIRYIYVYVLMLSKMYSDDYKKADTPLKVVNKTYLKAYNETKFMIKYSPEPGKGNTDDDGGMVPGTVYLVQLDTTKTPTAHNVTGNIEYTLGKIFDGQRPKGKGIDPPKPQNPKEGQQEQKADTGEEGQNDEPQKTNGEGRVDPAAAAAAAEGGDTKTNEGQQPAAESYHYALHGGALLDKNPDKYDKKGAISIASKENTETQVLVASIYYFFHMWFKSTATDAKFHEIMTAVYNRFLSDTGYYCFVEDKDVALYSERNKKMRYAITIATCQAKCKDVLGVSGGVSREE